MAMHKWKDIKGRKLTPAQMERLEKESLDEYHETEATMRALRDALGITQEELAKRLEVSQGQLSKIERRADDNRISTIREVVAALGGDVEVTAVFGKKRIKLVAA